MAEMRTMVPPAGSIQVRPVRIRPQLGPDLTSADGRVDRVAVDAVLRGESADLNRAELDEVCRILTDLRVRYHGEGNSVRPGTRFNDRSPYRQTLGQVAHALGNTMDELQLTMDRYRNKMEKREQRARQRRDQVAVSVAGLYPFARAEVVVMDPVQRRQLAELAADVITVETMTLVDGPQRTGPKPKDRPSPLAAVARAVALLADADGGVSFLGLHYCSRPHGDCPGDQNGTRTADDV